MLTATHRQGVTLIELLVAMVVGGLVLGLVVSIGLREQRLFGDMAETTALSGQLRDASEILPIDLRAAATSLGDIREAGDTSVELRGTIASAVVCDTASHVLVLAPGVAGAESFNGSETAIDIGDTAWVLSVTDTADTWLPTRISATTSFAASSCADAGPRLSPAAQILRRPGIVVDASSSLAAMIGMPIRVTRPLRLSLYRASDDAWYLGERDWSAANQRFNIIQPVSGPFLSAASHGLYFRYEDSVGDVLPTPVADTRIIALVSVELRGQTRDATRALGASTTTGKRDDSAIVSIFVRNRH